MWDEQVLSPHTLDWARHHSHGGEMAYAWWKCLTSVVEGAHWIWDMSLSDMARSRRSRQGLAAKDHVAIVKDKLETRMERQGGEPWIERALCRWTKANLKSNQSYDRWTNKVMWSNEVDHIIHRRSNQVSFVLMIKSHDGFETNRHYRTGMYLVQPSFVCNLCNHQLRPHDLDLTSEVFFT